MPGLTEDQQHAVGRALRAAYFAARRRGDDEDARNLYAAAGSLRMRDYLPEGTALADLGADPREAEVPMVVERLKGFMYIDVDGYHDAELEHVARVALGLDEPRPDTFSGLGVLTEYEP